MPTDKALLGMRYTCYQCGAKFYDLNREAALCPLCGADQADDPNPDPAELLRTRKRSRRRSKAEATPTPTPSIDVSDTGDPVETSEDED